MGKRKVAMLYVGFIGLLAVCIVVVLGSAVAAQTVPGIQWAKTFGGSADSQLNNIISTSDGGYIGIGFTNSTDGDITSKQKQVDPGQREDDDVLVVKLTTNGEVSWHTTLGGSRDDKGEVIQEQKDGSLIFAGTTFSKDGDVRSNQNNPSNEVVAWVVKLSATGQIIWEKTLSDLEIQVSSIQHIEITERGYLLGIQGSLNNFRRAHAVMVDFNGNIIWQKNLPGAYLYDITRLQDGSVLSAGNFLVNFSTNGDLQWQLNAAQYEQSIDATSDGGYIWAVSVTNGHVELIERYQNIARRDFPAEIYQTNTVNTSPVILVVKYDSQNNPIWANYLGGSRDEYVADIKQTPDGGYAVLSSTKSNDRDVSGAKGDYDIWLAKLSADGDLQWQKTLGGSREDYPTSIVTTENSFIVAGNTQSNDSDVSGVYNPTKNRGYDWWVVKLGYDGVMDVGNYPSDWARKDVDEARGLGLVSNKLSGDFQANITREDFSELVVILYEKLMKRTASLPAENPFKDTNNQNVLKAYQLGIVGGIGNQLFTPESTLTREQASVMYYRLMNEIKPGLDKDNVVKNRFTDHGSISEWAEEAVYYINYRGIIQGVGNNLMSPKGTLTREQAIILTKRLYEKIDEYILDEFKIVHSAPIILAVGEKKNIQVIIEGRNMSYSEKLPTWKIEDNSMVGLSGSVVAGSTQFVAGGVFERLITTSDKQAVLTGNKPGTTFLKVFIGAREHVQMHSIEVIVR